MLACWTPSSGQAILTLEGDTSDVQNAAFSPDGKRLASASSDRTVKVWDVATGQEPLTLKGHTGRVESVAFSPDGQRLASASADGTVKVFCARTLAFRAAWTRLNHTLRESLSHASDYDPKPPSDHSRCTGRIARR